MYEKKIYFQFVYRYITSKLKIYRIYSKKYSVKFTINHKIKSDRVYNAVDSESISQR